MSRGVPFVPDEQPLVSVIVPCRNEERWIGRCLESILQNDYPRERLEVFVVDGMSDDGTRAVVAGYAQRYPFIRLLDNPQKTTPVALNVGIEQAAGAVVMRMDAHYEYAANYISRLVHELQKSGADNVGGVWVPQPASDGMIAQAIAAAVSNPFAVGNAYYKTGATAPRWVDTVPFGCYRRDVFQRIGKFDEELVRNQDNEFNLRLKKRGGSILLVPDVVVYGPARGSLAKLCRMYYQYGYFTPLVQRKLGGRVNPRHLVPPAFVLGLLVTGCLAPWLLWMRLLLLAIGVAYGLFLLACTALVAARRGLRASLALPLVVPAMHISNGLGFLKGAFDFLLLRRNRKGDTGAIPLTR
jgi:glycosyltransferase involved in cell wall biosynthesis